MPLKLTSSLARALVSRSPPSKSKYGSRKIELDGEKYRSLRECDRHRKLMLFERAGLLANLRREVPFVLAPSVKIAGRTKPALRYFADFVYERSGRTVVEDCKGVRTAVYRIKLHLMATVHGVEILET